MKILLVSATVHEIKPLLGRLKKVPGSENLWSGKLGKNRVDALVTGVGMTASAFHLALVLRTKYDLAVQAGFAGSFRKDIPLGTLVDVRSDVFSDLGTEDGDRFLTLKEMGLSKVSSLKSPARTETVRSGGQVSSPKIQTGLRKAKGITVNTVHGNAASIRKVLRKFNPDVESMEGAAFFFACGESRMPCIQVRAISNYVERRNKKNWKLEIAGKKLNNFLGNFLKNI